MELIFLIQKIASILLLLLFAVMKDPCDEASESVYDLMDELDIDLESDIDKEIN
ncbi:hypothetical protein MYP_677 [Sporocytophaga myxococcoides]|uniref:Uncharacterized protein n=1 Tax=Sporocytophaga myxococcoides TaxID=153721 RepID=A0A098L989_9BACT|nr:hypothetical protein [Sporocytophaga myxococcoides]GAL83450.1 hypothetical protein MYP_677 [Sporocytophaga myxococcoides]